MVHLDRNLALARYKRALARPAAHEAIAETPTAESTGRSWESVPAAMAVVTIAVLFWFAAWHRTPAPDRDGLPRAAADPQTVKSAEPTARIPVSQSIGSSGTMQAARTAVPPPLIEAQPVPTDEPASSPPVSEVEAIPEPVSEGALIVTTEPAGAHVTVNDIGWGISR